MNMSIATRVHVGSSFDSRFIQRELIFGAALWGRNKKLMQWPNFIGNAIMAEPGTNYDTSDIPHVCWDDFSSIIKLQRVNV